jgi:hypothetical protein
MIPHIKSGKKNHEISNKKLCLLILISQEMEHSDRMLLNNSSDVMEEPASDREESVGQGCQ